MLALKRNTHLQIDRQHPGFKAEMGLLVEDIADTIRDRATEIACDQHLSDDDVTATNLYNAMLTEFTSFVLQRPVNFDEVLDFRHLKNEHARDYFADDYSPAGESEDPNQAIVTAIEALTTTIERLETKVDSLEGSVQLLRRKPSRHKRLKNRDLAYHKTRLSGGAICGI